MSVIYIEKQKLLGSNGTLKADGKNTYAERYTVLTDSEHDGPITVASHLFLPSFRQFFPHGLLRWSIDGGAELYTPPEFHLQCLLTSKTPNRKGAKSWEVDCNYEFVEPEQREEDPLKRPVKWSMSFAAYTRIAEKDIDGKLVQNSAGMQYNPPVEIDDSRPVVRAVRNEPDFYLKFARKFKDAINSEKWKGLPRHTVKVMDIQSGDIQEENGVTFYSVTYEFQLSGEDETWLVPIRDRGFYTLDDKGNRVVIKDNDEYAFQEPIDLNGKGEILEKGKEPIYKEWHLYPERDLNQLRL